MCVLLTVFFSFIVISYDESPREVPSAATIHSPKPRQTWTTYDDNAETAPAPVTKSQEYTSSSAFEEVDEVVEDLQQVKIVHTTSPSPKKPLTPPPAEQLSKPLPLGWD